MREVGTRRASFLSVLLYIFSKKGGMSHLF
uniref:Uncharacterized protein n=1 Tax=Siphoviridae sp. ctulf7 TaxID=2826505 RepID=A0A8S5M5R4_9CAUD|nr:MAG TPA: hypothetical protein [Siphoviridae sp. ctulf7]